MSVTLIRNYGNFLSGAVVTLPDATEAALIAQGFATAGPTTAMSAYPGGFQQVVSQGGNVADALVTGEGSFTYDQGPRFLPCFPMGSAALTGYETNGVAPVAGTLNLTEIYVPYWQTWTGASVLNGTTVGTDSFIVALYGSDGTLIANSALAGTLSAGASVFQNIPFTATVVLAPGRYFIGVQSDGTTATLRHILAANGFGGSTSATAGTFGTLPDPATAPTSFTTAVGVICGLYK
jgi:hypothetical protein